MTERREVYQLQNKLSGICNTKQLSSLPHNLGHNNYQASGIRPIIII